MVKNIITASIKKKKIYLDANFIQKKVEKMV